MGSIADEDWMPVKIFHLKCVYFVQPVSEIPYFELRTYINV